MKVLHADQLSSFAACLASKGHRVIAPVRDGQVVRLALWNKDLVIDLSQIPVNSVKDFLLPRSEVIGRFSLHGNDFTPIDVLPDTTETILLCIRPCDAASLRLLDTVFNWDFKDTFYNARRLACTVVSLSCTSADSSCFCTSVHQAPDSTQGSDLVFRSADQGYKFILEPVNEKGQALIDAAGKLVNEEETMPDPLAEVPKRFEVKKVIDWLASNFDSPLWTELSLGCLGCGACAYACPSCHCFDIQDESNCRQSARYRNWDNCGLAIFTAHTSGHNPRPDRLARWRQRVMHKFSYIPQRFELLGCTGCGRCARLCPNGMAIIEVCQKIEAICNSQATII